MYFILYRATDMAPPMKHFISGESGDILHYSCQVTGISREPCFTIEAHLINPSGFARLQNRML